MLEVIRGGSKMCNLSLSKGDRTKCNDALILWGSYSNKVKLSLLM